MKTKKRPAKKTARRPAPARQSAAMRRGIEIHTMIAQCLSALTSMADVSAVEMARKINARLAKDASALWTTGDGSRVRVADMSDQHLFFALAKARRGEYPDARSRRVEVATLESEALRRLLRNVK